MKKNIIQAYFEMALIILMCSHGIVHAQFIIPGYGMQAVVGGYDKDIEGERLPYFSSYRQFAREALLTRCTDGKKIISWYSAPVAADFDANYCYFYFLAGHSTGTSKADRHFDLYIDDKMYVTITTPQKKKPPFVWNFAGRDSVEVIFDATYEDVHTDAHGNLFLKVPRKLINPGKPLKFSIVGQAENSNDWFMIFRYRYVEKIIVQPTSLLVKKKGALKQIVSITADHTFNTSDTLNIKFGTRQYNFFIKPGYNFFELFIDPVKEHITDTVYAEIAGKFEARVPIHLYPAQIREVSIIHHSHNDIGYSHLQDEVVQIQNNNIRESLRLIEKTKNYPPGCRFIWNIESLWAVDNFLGVAGNLEKANFFNAVRLGQICLSAHYANILTGLCTPEVLPWITERAEYLRNKYKLPIHSVMLTDIPGVSWSEVQMLAEKKINYFSNGPNYQPHLIDKGDRIGATLHECGDKPFYWLGADGKSKILFWTAGRGYSMFHQIPFPDLDEKRTEKIVEYMYELDSINYAYHMVQMRYNIKSDNGPTDSTLCDFVKAWNEKYVSPRLVITSVNNMMEKFEKKYRNVLPVKSGDFTPYWEDGAYSTAREEAQVRIMSERIIQLENLQKLAHNDQVDSNWFYMAHRSMVMFQEHTWGSWNSISDPDAPFTTSQWDYKKSFLDTAQYFLNKIEVAMLPNNVAPKKIEVWNTLEWSRSGYIEVDAPQGFVSLVDENNKAVPYQRLQSGRVCFFANAVPAKSKKEFVFSSVRSQPETEAEFISHFTLTVDSLSGSVKSLLYDNKEWITPGVFGGINSALYVAGNNPRVFALSKAIKIDTLELGCVMKQYAITCTLNGTSEIKYIITQFNGSKHLRLSTVVNKLAIRDKESVHIAFPFALAQTTTRIGMGDTCIGPERAQIEAGNRDFFSVQRWIDVSDSVRGITLSSPQCALWEIGEMVDEQKTPGGEKTWKRKSESSPTLFAYVMNNYWTTNYKADQAGMVQFDFYLQLHDKFSREDANHFGYESNQPLLVISR